MGKTKAKKKSKSSIIKQLGLTLGLATMVIIIAVVIINAINKTTIRTVTVEGAYKELYIGNPELGSTTIKTSVYPETANKSSLVAYSKNPEIASVEYDGENLSITAVGVGTTEIYLQHASKSSLYDKVEICVKDIDVQSLTFLSKDEGGVAQPITSTNIKKDGFEHVIPFDIEPYNGNMNNLKVSNFNQAVFESVQIDQVRRALVVVPKTDIVQTSAVVDIEIYQNTTEGYCAVQVVSLMVNLKNREAYVNFEVSNDPSKGYTTLGYEHAKALKQIVYLDGKNATNVYIRPIIGYDINFSSTGVFNWSDYDLYYDGEKITQDDFDSNGAFSYKNKLRLSKSIDNSYYVTTLDGFVEGDAIYVEFNHKYTGASGGIRFIYLSAGNISLTSFGVYDKNGVECSGGDSITLNENDVFMLNFTYDQSIENGIIEIQTYKTISDDVKEYTNVFGDEHNEETIRIKKDNKKLSVMAKNLTSGTRVHFAVKWNYWDSRYAQIDPNTNISVTFIVKSAVNGLHLERLGKETNLIELVAGGNEAEVILVSEPENGTFDSEGISISVTLDGVISDKILVGYNGANEFEVQALSDAPAGTYEVVFEYNGVTTTLFVVV